MASDSRKTQYLKAMGIPVWSARRELPGERKSHNFPVAEVDLDTAVIETDSPLALRGSKDVRDDATWYRLQQEVTSCTACDLHQTRTNTVFGVGNLKTDLMIIGEAPGQDEDRQGEPFVGRAGQLLNQMLESIGFNRNKVFIANILKCRPPNNRDPRPEEVIKCADFLLRQIQWINPKIILSVGRISAQNMLQKTEAIGRLRGQVYSHPVTKTPVIVTYHPAYLLRSPLEKSKAWHDLVLARRILAEIQ